MGKDCFSLHILGNPQFAWKREVCMLMGGLKLFLWLVVFLAAESNCSWHPRVAGLQANSRSYAEGTTEDAPAWMWESILPAICSSASSRRGPSRLRSTASVDDDLFFPSKMRTGFVFGKPNNLKEAAFTLLTWSKARGDTVGINLTLRLLLPCLALFWMPRERLYGWCESSFGSRLSCGAVQHKQSCLLPSLRALGSSCVGGPGVGAPALLERQLLLPRERVGPALAAPHGNILF